MEAADWADVVENVAVGGAMEQPLRREAAAAGCRGGVGYAGRKPRWSGRGGMM
jgi:hypothetical protein